MKRILLLVSALSVLSACGEKPHGLKQSNLLAHDAETDTFLLDPADLKNFVLNQRIGRQQVVKAVADLQQSFKNSYIGYELKKNLIGRSGDEIFASCNEMIPN